VGGTPGRFHIGVQDDGTLSVKSFTPDPTRLLTIEPGGNVGIGTDDPISGLHIGQGSLFLEDDFGDIWFMEIADIAAYVTADTLNPTLTPSFVSLRPHMGKRAC
jgi:hypothetical protein